MDDQLASLQNVDAPPRKGPPRRNPPFADFEAPTSNGDDDVGAPIVSDVMESFAVASTPHRHEGLFFYLFNRDSITIDANGEQRVIGSFSSELDHKCFDVIRRTQQGVNVLEVYFTEAAISGTSNLLPPLEEHYSLYVTVKQIDFSAPSDIQHHLERARSGKGVRPVPSVANAERDAASVGALDKQIGKSRPFSMGRWEPAARSIA